MVRQRTRHLLLELIWKDRRRELSQKEFTSLLLKWINRLYGPSGTASILPNLAVRFFDGRSSLCILRCSRNQQQQVLAATSLITEASLAKLLVRLVRVSSTLPKIREIAIKFNSSQSNGPGRSEKDIRQTRALLLNLPKH